MLHCLCWTLVTLVSQYPNLLQVVQLDAQVKRKSSPALQSKLERNQASQTIGWIAIHWILGPRLYMMISELSWFLYGFVFFLSAISKFLDQPTCPVPQPGETAASLSGLPKCPRSGSWIPATMCCSASKSSANRWKFHDQPLKGLSSRGVQLFQIHGIHGFHGIQRLRGGQRAAGWVESLHRRRSARSHPSSEGSRAPNGLQPLSRQRQCVRGRIWASGPRKVETLGVGEWEQHLSMGTGSKASTGGPGEPGGRPKMSGCRWMGGGLAQMESSVHGTWGSLYTQHVARGRPISVGWCIGHCCLSPNESHGSLSDSCWSG